MRNLFITLSVLSFSLTGFAQYSTDFGINLGAANYLGEMGGKEKAGRPWILDMKMNQTKSVVGGFYRHRFKEKLGLNVGLNWGRISGADSLSTNPGRVGRNLSFRNDIIELSARGEYYFYHINDVGHTGRYQVDFKSYIFLGVAGYYSNPKAQYNGSWVALQPLQTEGQSYSKMNFSLPIGVGLFYTYKKNHRIGWEYGVRKTFTDYLDDVSDSYVDKTGASDEEIALSNRYNANSATTDYENYVAGQKRGDPKDNDWYMFTQFSYSYVIRGKGKFTKQKYSYLYSGKKRNRRTRAKF